MRFLIALAAVAVSGCVVQAHELARPQVAARFQSAKTAVQFAQCSATALGVELHNDGGVYSVFGHNRGGVRIARWDFNATLSGSEATLRMEDNVESGEAAVRGCA